MLVPLSITPHILGKGGMNLKDLISRTGTKIQVPRWDDNVDKDDSAQVAVTIQGHVPDVQQVKDEFQALIDARVWCCIFYLRQANSAPNLTSLVPFINF